MVYGVWCVVWWKLCRAQTEVELELELSDATRLRIDIIQERQQRLLCLPSFLHSHYWTNLPSRYASKPLDIPPVIHFRSTSIPTATTPVAEKGGISEDGPITTETKREKARSLGILYDYTPWRIEASKSHTPSPDSVKMWDGFLLLLLLSAVMAGA